jgi:hypothetical protein
MSFHYYIVGDERRYHRRPEFNAMTKSTFHSGPIDVPFSSQRGGKSSSPWWSDRCCAIACLTMVLNYYRRTVSLDDVLSAALDHQAFDSRRGWLHGGLVDVLHAYGLSAYRRNWRLLDGKESTYLTGRRETAATRDEIALVKAEMLTESGYTIGQLLADDVPVIVSIYRPWRDRSSVGHQVVLLADNDNTVVYHDPAYHSGAFRRRGRADFFDSWKGTAIVARDSSPVEVERAEHPLPSQ